MPRYTFELRFACPREPTTPAFVLERLRSVGCEDATVMPAKAGRLLLGFERIEGTASRALRRAVDEVQRALPWVRLVEAGPDVVGYAEIAGRAGTSRQNVRHASMHDRIFPMALHEGIVDLFHLDDVLVWIGRRQHRRVDVPMLEMAGAARRMNAARNVPAPRRRVGGRGLMRCDETVRPGPEMRRMSRRLRRTLAVAKARP